MIERRASGKVGYVMNTSLLPRHLDLYKHLNVGKMTKSEVEFGIPRGGATLLAGPGHLHLYNGIIALSTLEFPQGWNLEAGRSTHYSSPQTARAQQKLFILVVRFKR